MLAKWKKQKLEKNESKEKSRIIEAIWAMTEMIELTESDGKKTTIEHLAKKNTPELIKLMEDMLDEVERNI